MAVNYLRLSLLYLVALSLLFSFFMTEISANSKCSDGWVTGRNLSFCYKYISTLMKYSDALSACVQEEGMLVMPQTRDENEFVKSILSNISMYRTSWIGLNDIETKNEWTWIDDRTLNETNFSDWNQDEPNNYADEHCVAIHENLDGSYGWSDGSCDYVARVICEMDIEIVVAVEETEYLNETDEPPWSDVHENDTDQAILNGVLQVKTDSAHVSSIQESETNQYPSYDVKSSETGQTTSSGIHPSETDRSQASEIQRSQTDKTPSYDVSTSETDHTTLSDVQLSETDRTPSSGVHSNMTDYSTRHNTSTCQCACITIIQNATNFTFSHLIEDKKMLSSYRRKFISAGDPRASARASGYCGIVIICVLPVILVVMDCSSIKRHCNRNCSERKNNV